MIEIKNLIKLYKNNKGIKDVNFIIEKNNVVRLIGNNRAAKSTIIKSIFGEIERNEGNILYFNATKKDDQINIKVKEIFNIKVVK